MRQNSKIKTTGKISTPVLVKNIIREDQFQNVFVFFRCALLVFASLNEFVSRLCRTSAAYRALLLNRRICDGDGF